MRPAVLEHAPTRLRLVSALQGSQTVSEKVPKHVHNAPYNESIRTMSDPIATAARHLSAHGALGHNSWLELGRTTLHSWLMRSLSRRALAELDDRLLKDVGLTRAAIYAECRKHFWQR